jgi:hypothetical protein
MGFNYSPKIVTDGLVLYLDAANSKSYPGSGNAWNDISRGGNNGTLINSPTFSAANGGSLIFNGTNQYASVLNTTGINFTLACWISTTATSLTGTDAWQGNGIIWSDVAGIASDFVLAILNNQISWFTGNPDSSLNGSTILNTGAWFYITAVKNGSGSSKQVYVNGVSQGSTGAASGALTANSNIAIGGNTLDSRYFNGKIANTQIYNRALTATEVQQNYNATKSRFGLI